MVVAVPYPRIQVVVDVPTQHPRITLLRLRRGPVVDHHRMGMAADTLEAEAAPFTVIKAVARTPRTRTQNKKAGCVCRPFLVPQI